MWHHSAIFENSWPLFSQIWIIFTVIEEPALSQCGARYDLLSWFFVRTGRVSLWIMGLQCPPNNYQLTISLVIVVIAEVLHRRALPHWDQFSRFENGGWSLFLTSGWGFWCQMGECCLIGSSSCICSCGCWCATHFQNFNRNDRQALPAWASFVHNIVYWNSTQPRNSVHFQYCILLINNK